MRLRTHTQSWGDVTPGIRQTREELAAELIPKQHPTLLLTTKSGNKGWLMETEDVHSDAHLKMQQHRETMQLLGLPLKVAGKRVEELSIYWQLLCLWV